MSTISAIIDSLNYAITETHYFHAKRKKAKSETDKQVYLALANYYKGRKEAYLSVLDMLGIQLYTHLDSAIYDDVGIVEYIAYDET